MPGPVPLPLALKLLVLQSWERDVETRCIGRHLALTIPSVKLKARSTGTGLVLNKSFKSTWLLSALNCFINLLFACNQPLTKRFTYP